MDLIHFLTSAGMTARRLNAVGLMSGFAGSLMLTFWGALGWKVRRDGSAMSRGLTIPVGDPRRPRAAFWFWFRFNVMNKFALALVALAFLAQFLALWAPS